MILFRVVVLVVQFKVGKYREFYFCHANLVLTKIYMSRTCFIILKIRTIKANLQVLTRQFYALKNPLRGDVAAEAENEFNSAGRSGKTGTDHNFSKWNSGEEVGSFCDDHKERTSQI